MWQLLVSNRQAMSVAVLLNSGQTLSKGGLRLAWRDRPQNGGISWLAGGPRSALVGLPQCSLPVSVSASVSAL